MSLKFTRSKWRYRFRRRKYCVSGTQLLSASPKKMYRYFLGTTPESFGYVPRSAPAKPHGCTMAWEWPNTRLLKHLYAGSLKTTSNSRKMQYARGTMDLG